MRHGIVRQVAEPIAGDADLHSHRITPALSFTGDALIDLKGKSGITVTSTPAPAILDCQGIDGIDSDADTSNCEVSQIEMHGAPSNRWFGGNRRTQSGGGNVLQDVTLLECGSHDGNPDTQPIAALHVGGVGHTLRRLRFIRSVTQAIQLGAHNLPWDAPDINGVNGLVAEYIAFVECYTAGTADSDHGVLYGGRSLVMDAVCKQLHFEKCKAVARYWDDLLSNMTVLGERHIGNLGMDFKHGGGRRLLVRDSVSTGSQRQSVWDDRGHPSVLLGSLQFHGLLHATAWSHGGDSGDAGVQKLVTDHGLLTAGGAENWKSRMDAFGYSVDWAAEATWTSSGVLGHSTDRPVSLGGTLTEVNTGDYSGA